MFPQVSPSRTHSPNLKTNVPFREIPTVLTHPPKSEQLALNCQYNEQIDVGKQSFSEPAFNHAWNIQEMWVHIFSFAAPSKGALALLALTCKNFYHICSHSNLLNKLS